VSAALARISIGSMPVATTVVLLAALIPPVFP
jgi:hypothetical protein